MDEISSRRRQRGSPSSRSRRDGAVHSGPLIVRDGEIIGRGQNRVLLTGIPVFHAEVTAIMDASPA